MLEHHLWSCVTVGVDSRTRLRVAASFSPAQVWPAMASLGMLQSQMQELVQRLCDSLLPPLLFPDAPAQAGTVLHEQLTADDGSAALYCLEASDDGGSSARDPQPPVEAVLSVLLRFLAGAQLLSGFVVV